MKIKEKIKTFWEEHGEDIKCRATMCVLGVVVFYTGYKYADLKIGYGIIKIAEVTPELTFGEYHRKCLDDTFDISLYK